MAEISYPFDQPNANGGTNIVSQVQWQQMAAFWGGDRIDFHLSASSYSGTDLPFTGWIENGRDVRVGSGSAWVGGFYYQNTGTLSFTISANASTKPRKDLVVIRADMAQSSVQMAVKEGTAASTPAEPRPTRSVGGVWELPLYCVDVPANNGAITVSRRGPFYMPSTVAYPWSAEESAKIVPRNAFAVDVDSNSSGGQFEAWNGTDGYVTTRHLGKARTYTPAMVNCSNPATRQGRWRYIAPNTVWFSIYIASTSSSDIKASGSNWIIGVTLPVKAKGSTGQTFTGHLDNNGSGNSTALPNFVSLIGKTSKGADTSTMHLFYPNANTTSQGLDGLKVFPRKGSLTISGVYEADQL
ncbi:hypothetical protein ACG2OD_14600 [Streptomyces sp. PDY-4]|uniref:hypothetical protein n=1 Tax=Streptomyces sp. PDY-4 TaxID=3376070 RepID=UPI0037AEB05A